MERKENRIGGKSAKDMTGCLKMPAMRTEMWAPPAFFMR